MITRLASVLITSQISIKCEIAGTLFRTSFSNNQCNVEVIMRNKICHDVIPEGTFNSTKERGEKRSSTSPEASELFAKTCNELATTFVSKSITELSYCCVSWYFFYIFFHSWFDTCFPVTLFLFTMVKRIHYEGMISFRLQTHITRRIAATVPGNIGQTLYRSSLVYRYIQ